MTASEYGPARERSSQPTTATQPHEYKPTTGPDLIAPKDDCGQYQGLGEKALLQDADEPPWLLAGFGGQAVRPLTHQPGDDARDGNPTLR
jgi:hypothetical protein